MSADYPFAVAERFMKYVQIDTQSDPQSLTQPSTEKQKDLGVLLVEELQAMGIGDAELDVHGYVYATIEANTDKKVPVICFCAHMDTSPDCSGASVKPIIHKNFDGTDINLPDDPSQVIRVQDHPYLKEKIGDDIITASGTTLLGADDKAGVAVIMELADYLSKNPSIDHGKIRLLFTPDEEIGRGVNAVDITKLAADIGYTLDGGQLGSYEDETFSADGVRITIYGVSAHPGYAKDKLVNAIKVGTDFLNRLPKQSFSPETTSDREGFVHPVRFTGIAEEVLLEFIVRDFDTAKLQQYESFLREKLDETIAQYPGARSEFVVTEQYRNMKEVILKHPEITANAHEAIRRAGIPLVSMSARGGTDGSRLSFMGLPCPNLFTGEMAFHGKHEYVSRQDMEKSVQVLIELVQIFEENA
jgi:tripeptide aminopeptidase